MAFNFPIGTVLAYAGDASNSDIAQTLEAQGWWICDGRHCDSGTNPDLAAVLGTAYGSDSGTFYIPDYRGRFLRGVNGGKTTNDGDKMIDPDAASRTAPNLDSPDKGNTGDAVGSVQDSQIKDHTHAYTLPSYVDIEQGHGDWFAMSKPEENITTTIGGAESRPANMSVWYIIKYKLIDSTPDAIAGIVLAYGNDADNPSSKGSPLDGWLACHGALIGTSNPSNYLNKRLYAAYGQDNNGNNYLPDYRGYFHRGVDDGAGRDVEVSQRLAPRSDLPNKGNIGDAVGSLQSHNFSEHCHVYDDYPDQSMIIHLAGHSGRGSNPTGTSTASTGGSETRPVNAYVDFIIGFYDNDNDSPVPTTFTAPIGSIIAYAGSNLSSLPKGWLLCDGSLYRSNTYNTLATAISTLFGERDPNTFAVPDFRGKFLRCADIKRGVDPDITERTIPRPDLPNPGSIGPDVGSVQLDQFASHSHTYHEYIERIRANEGAGTGSVNGSNGQQATLHSLYPSGPHQFTTITSTETRPANMYVYYLIYAGE